MDLKRHIVTQCSSKRRYDRLNPLWREKSGGIFDVNRIDELAFPSEFLGAADVELVRMNWADAVDEPGDDLFCSFFARDPGSLQERTHVVHRFNDLNAANAVADHDAHR